LFTTYLFKQIMQQPQPPNVDRNNDDNVQVPQDFNQENSDDDALNDVPLIGPTQMYLECYNSLS
jgi:hypothetical protein